MREIAQNIEGGFDIAVLTQKRTGEALMDKALPFPETVLKGGLLIISKEESNKYTPSQDTAIQSRSKKTTRTNNRKRIIFDDTFLHNGKTYQVNSSKSGLYVEILTKIIEQFEIAQAKWKRVFVLRFDLHTHRFTEDNKLITAFRKRLFQKLKRVYGFKEIGFCWVREQERAKTQHYHFVLFLDGRLIRHSSKISGMVKAAWEDPTGTFTVWYVKRPFYFTNSEDIIQKAIYRVSYLAKPRGKGYRPAQTKDYQCSRMKA
ncbi:MAG: hypothetical protein COA83_02145 [Methylophaga sp.]|nr:MAG: hypothetical protein COA83_02145 [Methylophaga sp.]